MTPKELKPRKALNKAFVEEKVLLANSFSEHYGLDEDEIGIVEGR